MNDSKSTDLIAALDQFATSLENMGGITAGLYVKLIDGGIPREMAESLVLNWWNTYWTQFFTAANKQGTL